MTKGLKYDGKSGVVIGWPTPVITDKMSDGDMDVYDAMQAAYKAEYDRWDWRVREGRRESLPGSRYELVRNSSPGNDINADEYFEVVTFTKRECQNIAQIENWLEAYRGRAAMKMALAAHRTKV